MTESPTDNQLKAEFRELRATETQAAADYRRSLAGPSRPAPRRWSGPAMQFATVAAVLVVAIAVFFNTGRNQTLPEMVETMPTDFLLDTPWFELARTTPNFDFQFPQYDIPEDLSDEI